jgi:hypothetical protein
VENIDERAVFPEEDAIEGLALFDEPPPENPGKPSAILKMSANRGER